MRLKKRMGEELAARLDTEWTSIQCVQAGHWLLECAYCLDFFDRDERGLPKIADEHRTAVDQLREDLIWLDPVYMPHLEPPPDWTGWWKEYPDRLRATFVRDWRPETRAAITGAFKDPGWEHAKGVNALKRVPLKINTPMLDVIAEFAVEIMGHSDDKRKADDRTVANDLSVAKWVGQRTFYLDYNCDKRGRVYAIQHFNYGREDHVRSLFKFANGMPLGSDGTTWLEIHCANCEGSTDKEPWSERIKWVGENRGNIQRIAQDPFGTFDIWKEADKPFCFVAACMELAAAWADPANFVTTLPVAFDGTCNGLQQACAY
jgi:DNA-directed RNA polymerase